MSARAARALLLALVLGWSCGAGAQLAVPPLRERVSDQTGTLTAGEKAGLEQTLQAFEARKGSQIGVLIVPTTAGESIEQYSLRAVEQWKLGRKKVDDGALLVVAMNDKTLRIEVGYGLEGVLTDAASKRIVSELIIPRFRAGDFAGGIRAGVEQMIRIIDGESLPAVARRPATDGFDLGRNAPVILLLALAVGGVLRAVLGRFLGALVTGGVAAVIAWAVAGAWLIAVIAGGIAFVLTLFGGAGFIPGFGGGRGGGFGSGGFGGGGGSFGGGGASGKW